MITDPHRKATMDWARRSTIGSSQIVWLPPHEMQEVHIHNPWHNSYDKPDEDSIMFMARAIVNGRVLPPPILRPKPTGIFSTGYVLQTVDGRHRVRTYQRLGLGAVVLICDYHLAHRLVSQLSADPPIMGA